MHRSAAIASSVLALASCSAFAELVSVDTEFGADTGTVDTSQQLLFLDVNQSVNISYDTMISVGMGTGGIYEGWRHATVEELSAAWAQAGLSVDGALPLFAFTSDVASLTSILDLFGRTETNAAGEPLGRSFGFTAPVQPGIAAQSFVSLDDPLSGGALGIGIPEPANSAFPSLGHWLVRDIPAPGTSALLVITGVVASRRRQ